MERSSKLERFLLLVDRSGSGKTRLAAGLGALVRRKSINRCTHFARLRSMLFNAWRYFMPTFQKPGETSRFTALMTCHCRNMKVTKERGFFILTTLFSTQDINLLDAANLIYSYSSLLQCDLPWCQMYCSESINLSTLPHPACFMFFQVSTVVDFVTQKEMVGVELAAICRRIVSWL